MAKIIKHGNMYDRKVTCRRCRCEFIAEKDDIHYPTINVDKLADDGNVHLSILRGIKNLPRKNDNERFYIYAEMFEYLTPEIICPECGEPKPLTPELIVFDDDTEIWVTNDSILQEAIEKDTYDNSPAWDVGMMLVGENTYPCMRFDLNNLQYYPADIWIRRPDTKNNKELYEKIKDKLEKYEY